MEEDPKVEHILHPTRIQEQARHWLKEDTPSFDYGGIVVGDQKETAVLLCKSPGVLAGVPFFNEIFRQLNCSVQWNFPEGSSLSPICEVATVTGKARNILLGERTALNCLTRCSGVATVSKKYADIAKENKWHGEVAGTRKTTPGFRLAEKYALLVGGVSTHRHDLSSMIMLKDNHIWSAGSIKQAVMSARKVGGFSTKIEVECRSVAEAREAASAGAEIVMLDNFEPKTAHSVAATLKEEFPNLLIELSGGVTEDNIASYFDPNIDVISSSQLTQGYSVVNFSLKICKTGHDPTNPIVNQSR